MGWRCFEAGLDGGQAPWAGGRFHMGGRLWKVVWAEVCKRRGDQEGGGVVYSFNYSLYLYIFVQLWSVPGPGNIEPEMGLVLGFSQLAGAKRVMKEIRVVTMGSETRSPAPAPAGRHGRLPEEMMHERMSGI